MTGIGKGGSDKRGAILTLVMRARDVPIDAPGAQQVTAHESRADGGVILQKLQTERRA